MPNIQGSFWLHCRSKLGQIEAKLVKVGRGGLSDKSDQFSTVVGHLGYQENPPIWLDGVKKGQK